MKPRARREHLVVQDVDKEVVVYDTDTHEAHSLNAPAAAVWRHCDGERSLADLAVVLHDELGLPADEAVVRLALEDLEGAHLLEEPLPSDAPRTISRRELFDQLKVAAFLLPVVASIVAPMPMAAQSASVAPSPLPTTPSGSFTFNISGVLTNQTGNCNFHPSFTGTIVTAISGTSLSMTLTESVTRKYTGTIQSNGAFSCSGVNIFNGCTDSSTCSGTVGPNLTNPTSISCTEVNAFSVCCAGTGTYGCTGSR